MKQFKPIGSHWNGGQILITMCCTPRSLISSSLPEVHGLQRVPAVHQCLWHCSQPLAAQLMPEVGKKPNSLVWRGWSRLELFWSTEKKYRKNPQLAFSYNAEMKISLRNPVLGWNMRWENKYSPFTCLMFHIILEVFHCLTLMFSDYFYICLKAIPFSNGPSS